jgi:hypothetical protein
MIGYVTVGTNDLPRAAQFYDAIAAEMDTPRMMEFDGFVAWGKPDGPAGIAVIKPFDGNAASVGNGVMVAFEAKDKDQVQRLYDIASPMAVSARVLRDRAVKDSMPVISAIPTATS